MKEKLLAALKLACKDLAYISDRTIEAFATSMEASVTEESQIEAAITAQKAVLESVNGLARHQESEGFKKGTEKKPEDKKPEDKKPEDQKPSVDMEAIKLMMEEMLNPVKEQLSSSAKLKSREQLIAEANAKITEKYPYLKEETQKKRMEYAMNSVLKAGDPENVDKLVEGFEAEYNTIASQFGSGTLKPTEAGGGADTKPARLSALKEKLQKQGKLPKEE